MADEIMVDAAPQTAPEAPAPVPAAPVKDWTRALVVAGGAIPKGESRPTVVTEVRDDDGSLVKQTYPTGADVYLRFDPDADLNPKQITMGVQAEQGMLGGFSSVERILHVGPAHPAYAGANLAFINGASEIEVTGLSPLWKERLQPWFDGIATDPRFPATVKITLT